MGNHHSHEKDGAKEAGNGITSRKGSLRAASTPRGSNAGTEAEKPEKPQIVLVPVEKLGKLLAQRSQKEDGVNGVTENSFTKYLFPLYPELARQFFRWVHSAGRCKNHHIPVAVFRHQCEKVLALLDDTDIIETYVRMFGSESGEGVEPAGFRSLLYTSYKLSMDHYPEGPQTCLKIEDTLSAVESSCFNNKESHSVGFVVRWLEDNCRRIIFPMHRYCVHMISTRHRDLSSGAAWSVAELATPVLDRAAWPAAGAALTVSAAWLVSGGAPALYSRPSAAPVCSGGLWLSRLVCALPSHWAPLYASAQHGLAANRFLHHTLAYRGPTLVVISARGSPLTLVVGSSTEWRETHQYWGSADCFLMQLSPQYCMLERAPRMLYLNTAIRGYPLGLRAGSDPRKPTLAVNADFDHFEYNGAKYAIANIEVWGCGDQASRETQLEIKKWQVREAERQRQVKLSAADWIEHPDRYLLELAGRPQYNNSAS